jgi:hypothetical protein
LLAKHISTIIDVATCELEEHGVFEPARGSVIDLIDADAVTQTRSSNAPGRNAVEAFVVLFG